MKKSTELETKSPNDEIDLSGFNYRDLTGEKWKEYKAILDSLPANKEFEFEQHFAVGIFEKDFNRKTGVVEDMLVGIRLRSASDPINITKIPASYARNLNEQIYSKHPASNSRFFLLKKGDVQNA